VGFGPLGLARSELSELAAVAWNAVLIVAAGGDGIPGGLFQMRTSDGQIVLLRPQTSVLSTQSLSIDF